MSDPTAIAAVADPGFWEGDPYPGLARLRSEAPLAWFDEPGFWAVSKHADVLRVSRDPDTFCSARGVLLMDLGRELPELPGALLYVDPPEHQRYRRIVNPGFSTSRMRRLDAEIRARVRALLDRVAPGEPVDVVEALAVPLPLLVIADLLGVPGDEWRRFWAWSDACIAAASGMTAETDAAMIEMAEFFQSVIVERRADPREDLVSLLATVEVEGEQLNDGELMMFLVQLLVAGNETTRNLVSGGLVALADHPRQWERLRSNRALAPTAVEELLRWTTPVIAFMRTATRDTELRNTPIRAGEALWLLYTSANRDEEVFGATAGTLDIGRDPNPQLAFGFGEHFCLGAALARIEGRIVLEEVAERFARIERAGPVARLRSEVIAGVLSAPLALST